MRIQKLTMTAFGSYAGTTEIDFADLDGGLYLVRGDTGAGKTTIFDAIVFALYGESSGGAREPAMMHSDFAPKTADMAVELDFEHGGGRHHVRRSVHFGKNRATNEYEAQSPDAEFREEGKTVINGARKVNKRIQELLGLDATQFRQIVMLAQGEFRQFLEAKSDKRAEILGRIFDTAPYRALQDRLKAAADLLRARRREDEESVRRAVEGLELPPDLPEEDVLRLRPRDDQGRLLRSPTVAADLAALLERERTAAQSAQEDYGDLDQALQKAIGRKEVAEMQNNRLDELEQARSRLEALRAQEGGAHERERLLERGRHAAAVRTVEDRLSEARTNLEAARRDLTAAEADEVAARDEARLAREANAALSEERERATMLATDIANLRNDLPEYARLAEAERNLEACRAKVRDADKRAAKADGEYQSASKAVEEIDKSLAALGNAEAEAGRADEAARAAGRDLAAYRAVCTAVVDAKRTQEDLRKAEEELRSLAQDAIRKKNEWSVKYDSFVMGQAGLMSERLAEEIRTSGSGRCPVCGTVHGAVGEGFARKDAATATQAEVEKAKAAYEKADGRGKERKTAVDGLRAALGEKVQHAETSVRAIPGCETATWDDLADDAWRAARTAEFEETSRVASARKAQADENVRQQKDLTERRRKESERMDDAEAARRVASEEKTGAETEAAGFVSAIEQWRRRLPYATEAEARRTLAEMEAARKRIEEKTRTAEAGERDSRERLASRTAAREAMETHRKTAEDAVENGLYAFRAALAAEGYADESAYLGDAALLPRRNVQPWLNGIAEECQKFRSNLEHAAADVERLVETTKDYRREDVGALVRACDEARGRRDDANEAARRRDVIVRGLETALATIRECEGRLARTEAGMRRLDELATLATGGAGGGADRVDFVRHMLGDKFREVLAQANVRLDRMSRGKFELVHREGRTDGRSLAGLDIDVFDRLTGARRQAATFSGGEGFQASMALALGLADTVRNHAGDIQLESTFIDEGFGSLDDTALEDCVRILQDLARGSRQVGIISHVAKLEEDVWPQIVVERGEHGSTLRIAKR